MSIDITGLQVLLETTVPFLIHELAERGGPDDRDWAFLGEFGALDIETPISDMAMFPKTAETRQEKRQVKEYWQGFQRCISIMAFCPGGIKICNTHFSAGMPDLTGKRSEVVGVFPQTRIHLDAIAEAILEQRVGSL